MRRRRHVAASFAARRARQETQYLGGRSWVMHFMQIAINDDGPAATITMVGRLDTSGVNDVAVPLATLSGSKSSLFVDMAGVTFLASLGLRHLLTAAKAMARRGGHFALINPSAAVTEVITITGLTGLLQVERRGSKPQN